MVNNVKEKYNIHQSHKHTSRDDVELHTSRPAQKPSHQIDNNEMMWQPILRNEALVNDMFGVLDPII